MQNSPHFAPIITHADNSVTMTFPNGHLECDGKRVYQITHYAALPASEDLKIYDKSKVVPIEILLTRSLGAMHIKVRPETPDEPPPPNQPVGPIP